MKNISICILDNDAHYVKAFMSVVALEHAGFVVGARSVCNGECAKNVDVCIRFEPCVGGAQGSCEKAFQPGCGRHAGVSAILSEARAFAIDRKAKAHGAGRIGGIGGIGGRIGLSGIGEVDIDTIVIAGVGGETMIGILEGSPCAIAGKKLILQPQTKKDELLGYLTEAGIEVLETALTRDRGREYTVLLCNIS